MPLRLASHPAFARKPFIDVRDFGVSDAGGTDDTAGIQAAIDSLAHGPGTIYLPRRALTGGFGIYWLSGPLTLYPSQNLVGEAISGSALKALPSFSGTAMILSNTWTAGGDPNSYWHWSTIDNLRIDCAGYAPIGVALHAMGENSALRRLLVLNATDSGIVLTGAHAPATIEHVSVSNSTNYGLKLTSHPTYSGNSGATRLAGYSGDNNLGAHIYVDGAHSVTLTGWKSESHFVGILVNGNSPLIFASGNFNTGRAAPDLIKIANSATPRIVSVVRSVGITNHVNDTVNSRTVPVTAGGIPPLITYGAKSLIDQQADAGATPARPGRYLAAPASGPASSANTFAVGSQRYVPIYFDRAGVIAGLGFNVTTGNAGAFYRLGVYVDNDGQPSSTPLVDTGQVDASTTGYKEATTSVAVAPGTRYWISGVSQAVAATISSVPGIAAGIPATTGFTATDCTAWVDAASVTGALPSANPTTQGRGPLLTVRMAS